MSDSKKLSLRSAIFINLNVMIGTGIFINTYRLATDAGAAGFLIYPFVGILMLPLIAVIGQLIRHNPIGGVYAFASNYSSYFGFLSCWSYFFGKLASASLMLTVAGTMMQRLVPILQNTNSIWISLTVLASFTLLNLQNMKVGSFVQNFFLTSKSIPIVFAIAAGYILFDSSTIMPTAFMWQGMATNIPLVLYCLAGFETASSLSRNIENPTVNGPKAVYYSFGIIMFLYGLFQGSIYIASSTVLSSLTSYDGIFPAIAGKVFSSDIIAHKVGKLLTFAIGSSALGGTYGILFSNSWNLYTLAENNHTFGASHITQLNKHKTPWIAVIAEAAICTFFLLTNQSSPLALQRTAALGIALTYTISTLAYLQFLRTKNESTYKFIVTYAALATCTLFISICAHSFIETGLAPLILFSTILTCGTIMFYCKQS